MDGNRWRRGHHGLGLALLVVSRMLIGQSAVATAPTATFDLPAGDFSSMLLEFGRQAHVEVVYTSDRSVAGIRTHAVAGPLSPTDALAQMLADTGFDSEWHGEHSVVLFSRAPAKPVTMSDATTELPVSGPSEVSGRNPKDIQEVLVTGTFLHGVDAVMAPVIRVRKQDFSRTGYATAEAALDELPMNFRGGARGDSSNAVVGNLNRGEAPNLRGLGAGATLVLVNGRRQPASGTGNFVDISAVPVSAIERIDIIPDGSSALYGSDAIAGVVNVITRDDVEGAETRTRVANVHGGGNEVLLAQLIGYHWERGRALFGYQFSKRESLPITKRPYAWNADKRALGGDDFRSFQSNPGNILDPQTFQPAYAIPRGQSGTDLRSSDVLAGQTNLQNTLTGLDLLPEQKSNSAYFTASQNLSNSLEGFAEARFNRRDMRETGIARQLILTVPASNAYYLDPFGGASPYVLVAYNFYDDLGAVYNAGHTGTAVTTLGLRAALPAGWRATLTASYGREQLHLNGFNLVDPQALDRALANSLREKAFNPFGAGSHTDPATLESIRLTQRERISSTVAAADLVSDGNLALLPGGAAKLALGVGVRQEELHQNSGAGTHIARRDYARRNVFTFAELSAPVVKHVELSMAGRYEQYNDFGSTLNQKLGLSWSPASIVKVRGSWGTSFKAPLLVDLDELNGDTVAGFLVLPDPRSPSGQSLVLGVQGNNAHLHQETATSWTAGIDFVAPESTGFTASLTYFAIDYRDQITFPGAGAPFSILLEESRWGAPVITRNPSRSQIDAICATPEFFGSRAECFSGLPDLIVDFRLRNLASTRVEGLDGTFVQRWILGHGEMRWGVDGTYLRRFERAVADSSAAVSLLNTLNNPIALRLRGKIDWYQRGENASGLAANLTAHYAGGYKDARSASTRRIDAATTLDLQLKYQTSKGSGRLDDVEIACGVVNAFDRSPSFANVERGYDVANGDATGRLLTFFLRKNW